MPVSSAGGFLNDNMLIQRGVPFTLHGKARPETNVVATFGDFAQARASVDQNGHWEATFAALAASSTPRTLSLHFSTGEPPVEFHGVMVGDVWVCGGQSNMQMYLKDCRGVECMLESLDALPLRLFESDRFCSDTPCESINGRWRTCTVETAKHFSGIAFAFGRRLSESLDIPIGLVDISWGGSPCEAFTRRDVLDSDPDLKPTITRQFDNPWQHAGVIWNGMLAPLVKYPVRGVIWYQGEANVERAWQYAKLLPAMINDWRKQWRNQHLPFLLVQPAPYRYQGHDIRCLPELWEAQVRTARALPNVGIAVTTDVGDPDNVHPSNKLPIAERLASLALAGEYGRNTPCVGPVFTAMEPVGQSHVRLRFSPGEGGLVQRMKPTDNAGGLSNFEIAGDDCTFTQAEARIEKTAGGGPADTVIVWSQAVAHPRHVRFAWTDTAAPNLFNGAGFPAMPFRTDDLPMVTHGRK